MFNIFQPKVPLISAEELNVAISESTPTIIDVRTEGERTKGYIANSVHIPIDDFASKFTNIITDKNAPVVIYCLSGSRSALAADIMIKSGYTNVKSLDHGLLAWRAKKLPVVI